MSKKINKGHYHEAVDRIIVTQQNIESNLRNHPLIYNKKKYYKKIDKVQMILSKLYQKIGQKL